MRDQLAYPAMFIGPISRGKPPLPVDADADQIASVLRRALHTIGCRELGPEAAERQFGAFADTADGRVAVSVDEDRLRVRHPCHDELHRLARGPRTGTGR